MTTGVLAELADARALAGAAQRADLVQRIDLAVERMRADDATVAVVGEFKQGKSTLVNALLRTDICPVDSDIVTAVPTVLRFGRPPAAFLQVPQDDGALASVPVGFEELPRHIAEGDKNGVRAVEVRLDRRLLGAGLSIIDTPGVGGLDSAQGNLTLGALSLAGAALFVTDSAQELTAPEVEFLRRALERCPRAFCVLTKTDLYGEWRRIVEINQGHFERAGLDVPIVAVSSFLRMRAQALDDTALNAESGFPRLVELLRRDVLGAAAENKVAAARAEVKFVVGQLRERIDAEQAVAAEPAKAPEVARRYAEKTRRSAGLAGGSWQTVLGDGIQDLSADVEHDLRERLRIMVRRGEDLLAESDPRETWRDFQAWAQREAAAAAVDNLMLLVTRTEQLAHDVAERFGIEYDSLDVDLPAPDLALRKVDELDVSFQKSGMQQFLGAFTAARVTYGGFYMLGAVGAFFSVAFAAPLGLLAGVTLGRRMMKSERERQVQQRRLQAKQELRRYVDDVGFHVGRDCREATRRTQRFLRDEFSARAQAAERSAAATAAAVQEIAGLPPEERRRKADALAEQRRRLDRLAA
ncbi:dynamin family protein [Paractinoplanes ferrugineus]|uniref:Dynamin n=1 Tax=Paractinoplanes ferrugineus TaxID=113564 RepID=A0A919MJD8_9ACTN|nr:dynamin family protein [Actinoplanes ferrugineus]GIE14625.1 dynamin [Actinoplanes ferrugineus]